MRSEVGALIQSDWCPCEKGKFEHRHTQEECHVKMQAEISKPRNTEDCQHTRQRRGEN